jgi:tetratricopeptide (TPR) repeat protein
MKWLIASVLMAPLLHGGDTHIRLLAASVEKEPASLVRRCDLIEALLDRYRYTGEPALLDQAKEQIAAALKQDPSYFSAKKMEAWAALLDQHYPRALALAKVLNKRMPDDVEVYGYIVDADMALGNPKEAEEQANWMLRLRPENRQAMRRAAELREAFGDTEGAILMLNDIYRRTPVGESLERAWACARIAHLMRKTDPKRAEQLARQALKIAPDSKEAALALAEAKQ